MCLSVLQLLYSAVHLLLQQTAGSCDRSKCLARLLAQPQQAAMAWHQADMCPLFSFTSMQEVDSEVQFTFWALQECWQEKLSDTLLMLHLVPAA